MSLVLDAIKSRISGDPFNIEFAITHNCNSKCLMCNQWKTKSYNELTLNEIEKIFSSYDGFKVVGITGGEPTLRTDLTQIVLAITKSQPHLKRLFVTTNGLLPSKIYNDVRNILYHLDNTRLLTILVSIDGPVELHNKIRGLPNAYDKTIDTLQRLTSLRSMFNFNIGISATYSPYNYKQYDKVLDELERLNEKFDLESVICITWSGNLYGSDKWNWQYLDDLPQWIPRIKKFVTMKKSLLTKGRSIFYDLAQSFLENRKKQVVPCGGACIRYFMNAFGDLFPCVIWDKKIGSLRNNGYDLQELINSPQRHKIREEIENNKCPICFLTCELIPSMMANPLKTVWKML